MGDHHGLAVEGLRQHGRQPIQACCMQPDSIPGPEWLTVVLNDGKIRHALPGRLLSEKFVHLAEQGEIGPQDTAQESHAVDDHLVIVPHVDVIRRQGLQLVDQGDVVMVELVVPRHVDYRPIRESFLNPVQTAHPHTDIVRQNHDVGTGCQWREILELDVQVIQDVDSRP